MRAKKVSSGGRSSTPKRPAPTKVMRAQIAPRIRTLSNGQPRPKSRSK